MTCRRAFGALVSLLIFAASVALPGTNMHAATRAEDDDRARAAAAIEAAIAALGGQKYRAVTSIASTGVFTGFNQGLPGFPLPFVDMAIFPDRDRTEFGKKKSRVIQANTADRGWKYDGARELITAQDAEEVRAFQRYVRGNIDNVLRGSWRSDGAQLRYIGRSEIGPRKWTEGVAVEFADGFRVELFLDPQTHLPFMSRYREGAESGAAGSLIETWYHDVYLDFDGVKVPRTVDLYRDGVQTARIIYESVQFNPPIDPKLFDQPPNVKAIK